MPARFPVCPPRTSPQIRHVQRLSPALAFALATAVSALGAGGDDLARFNEVAIKPATAFIYVATVTMTIPPFVRHNDTYSSTYTARVFPYFYSEKGRIWITVPDEALRRVASGQSVDFTGRAVNEDGEERKVVGHASPSGRTAGSIQVRVFVTRRISITYDTTYELVGSEDPPTPVTPR
jgi:hypothetical protein